MICVPYLLYRLNPPELKDIEPARALAREKLHSLGRMKRDEIVLVFILVAVMVGWGTSPWHGIANAFVALAGLSAILVFCVFTWGDLLSERKAWDALILFMPLLIMAPPLTYTGVTHLFSRD